MYRRPFCIVREEKARQAYCPPVRVPGAALSESARIAAQQCPTAWVATLKGPQCESDISGAPTVRNARVLLPVRPGAPPPYVQAGSTPASLTTQIRATEASLTNQDPYNPATRFNQYFPPAPRPYVCPERIPNNLPIGPMPCVPPQRYEGSKQALARIAAEEAAAAEAAARFAAAVAAAEAERLRLIAPPPPVIPEEPVI
jgi:hypothetical protein